jgi:hypothetical protein
VDYEKPMRTGHKQRRDAVHLLSSVGKIGTALATEEENAEQLLLLSCLHSERQEHRFLLLNVTPLPKNRCSTLFTTGCKRFAEGGKEVFAFSFGFLFWGFLLWAFWCGRLLEGKRIAEGKVLEEDC